MPGTILKQLVTTPQPDNTNITAANSGFQSGAAGSGNTAVHLAAAAMGEAVGYRFTQSGSVQNNWFVDLDAPVAKLAMRVPFRYPGAPTANVAFIRFFPDLGHATNLGGFLFTTTNRLQYVENATSGLNVTSSSATPLVPGTDYVMQVFIDTTTATLTAVVFPRGSNTARLTLTGTLAAPTAIQSLRWGISTNSSLATLDTNSAFAVGRDDYLARTDVTNVAPSVFAGDDIVVEAGRQFSLTMVATDVDGTIQARTWTKISGPTVPVSGELTGTLTGTAPVELTDSEVVYRASASDDQGAVGSDDVKVSFLAATRRVKLGGVMVPTIRRARLTA